MNVNDYNVKLKYKKSILKRKINKNKSVTPECNKEV